MLRECFATLLALKRELPGFLGNQLSTGPSPRSSSARPGKATKNKIACLVFACKGLGNFIGLEPLRLQDDTAARILVRHVLHVRGDPPLIAEHISHRADPVAVRLFRRLVHRFRARGQSRPVHIIHVRHIQVEH